LLVVLIGEQQERGTAVAVNCGSCLIMLTDARTVAAM